jgi:nucleoside 2-deoxyribosyltransferase
MSLYLASSLSNFRRIRRFRDQLAAFGIQLTYDWTQWGERLENAAVEPLGPSEIAAIAERELSGVIKCDLLAVVLPGGNGTHVELGAGLALGKKIFMLNDAGETGSRPVSFHHLTQIKTFGSEEAFLLAITELFDVRRFAEQIGDRRLSEEPA